MQAGFADSVPKIGINSAILERTIRYAIKRQRLLLDTEEGARIIDALLEYIPEAIAIADTPGATVRLIRLYGQQMMGGHCSKVEGKWKYRGCPKYKATLP